MLAHPLYFRRKVVCAVCVDVFFDPQFSGRYAVVHPTTVLFGGNKPDALLFESVYEYYSNSDMAPMMRFLLRVAGLLGQGKYGPVLAKLKSFIIIFAKRVARENAQLFLLFMFWLCIVTRAKSTVEVENETQIDFNEFTAEEYVIVSEVQKL